MIDALGFKGIWKENEPENVLQRLEFIQNASKDQSNYFKTNHPKFSAITKNEVEVRFLSDTIVIAAHNSSHLFTSIGFTEETHDNTFFYKQLGLEKAKLDKISEFVALKTVVSIVVNALAASLAGANQGKLPPLNYRGAIAYGDYIVSDNFLIGQAVDDCGEWFESADAAITMFHPTADLFWTECQEIVAGRISGIIRNGELTVQDIKSYVALPELVSYEVPCKKGESGTARASAVNPFARLKRAEWESARDRVLGLMQPPERASEALNASIQRKRNNTESYLNFVIANAEVCFPPKPPTFEEAEQILRSRGVDQ